MLRFNPNTPILLYEKTSTYISDQGNSVAWTPIAVNSNGVFYCAWTGTYGDRQVNAQAAGVKDSATVRTFYNPTVYQKLRAVQVVIIKNADGTAIVNGTPDPKNPNVYELWGGVDNVAEENQFMEFQVRRYEEK